MALIVWTLADVLVKLRATKGWSQADLAEKADVGRATVARLEQGRETNTASINKVARAFGLRPGQLYNLVPRADDPRESVDTDLQMIVTRWRAASETTRSSLLQLLEDDPAVRAAEDSAPTSGGVRDAPAKDARKSQLPPASQTKRAVHNR